MKVLSIFGTRPEMIKMWSTLKKLDQLNFDHIMCHTGQNFTPELKDFFFHDLELRKPDYQLNISTDSYSSEVSDVIKQTDAVMEKVRPEALLILGDTYSGLSVLPASHRGIKIFHMEAGLRAWDKRMPEQRNRILIDHISDILLPYNNYHRENLIRENIHPSKIIVTGNTTFEAMNAFQSRIDASTIFDHIDVVPNQYLLVTCHRSENVDNPVILKTICDSLIQLTSFFKMPVVFPVHPRTESKLSSYALNSSIKIIKPLGFYDFNKLLKHSFCILSDSGTAAEEGLYYRVPNVTLRSVTERYETLESGGCIVSGLDAQNIIDSVRLAVSSFPSVSYGQDHTHSPSNVVVNSLRSQLKHYF